MIVITKEKMADSLGQLLKDLDEKGLNSTHVSMISPKCRVSLGKEASEKFMREYGERYKTEVCGISEMPNRVIPVIFDIDLKKPGEVRESLYDKDDVLETIRIIQRKIKELIPGDVDLRCVYLSKPPYVQDNVVKNGFHVHFPFVFMDISQYSLYLNKVVKQEIEDIFVSKVTNHGHIVDDCSKNCWLLYGSRKDTLSNPYLVEFVVDEKLQIVSVDEPLHTLLSIHHPIHREKYYYHIKENHIELIQQISALPKEYKNTTYTMEELEYYMEIIDERRADDYENWMQIGWALYSIGNGCFDCFDLWDRFSQKSSKYNKSDLMYNWETMYVGKYTIGTIKYLAKKDNLEAYREKQRDLIKDDIQGIHGTDNQIAKIMFKRFGDEVKCVSMKNGEWFQFRNHIWDLIEEAVCILEHMDMMSSAYLELERYYRDLFVESADKVMGELQKKYLKMGMKLGMNRAKGSILRECRQVFYDEYFAEKLNHNKYLIAFKNGVLDLKTHIFRNGNPDDYLSKRLPIEFRVFSDEDEGVIECWDFLNKVFPTQDRKLRDYFIDVSADLFIGGNFNKHFYFWTGDGNNGKSVTQKILARLFGHQYCRTLPSSSLTNKKQQSSGCTPEMVQLRGGVRLAFFQEPDNIGAFQIQLNSGVIKELSGNDDQYTRDVYEKGGDIRMMEPFFKPIMICNELLGMPNDNAVWPRVRTIPFLANFVEDGCPESAEEQYRLKKFPMDKTFDSKINSMLEPMAYILLTHLRMRKNCMKAPREVVERGNLYRRQNDVYQDFFDDRIVDTTEPGDELKISDVHSAFLEWYEENRITVIRRPNKKELEGRLKGKFRRVFGEVWKGYQIIKLKPEFMGQDDEKDE